MFPLILLNSGNMCYQDEKFVFIMSTYSVLWCGVHIEHQSQVAKTRIQADVMGSELS